MNQTITLGSSRFSATLRMVVTSLLLVLASFFCSRADARFYSGIDLEIELDGGEKVVNFYFPLGKTVIDTTYLSNPSAIADFRSLVASEDLSNVESILIESGASPEGPTSVNENLAIGRGQALGSFLRSNLPSMVGTPVEVRYHGEDWDGLRNAVASDGELDSELKSAILSILDSGSDPDTKKARLSNLAEYNSLYAKYYPTLRYALLSLKYADAPAVGTYAEPQKDYGVVYESDVQGYSVSSPAFVPLDVLPPQLVSEVHSTHVAREPEVQAFIPADTVYVFVRDTVYVRDTLYIAAPAKGEVSVVPEKTPVVSKERNTIAALKTNLLYDALTVLNFEVEVPFAHRFSLMVEDVFPWWEYGNKYCLQMWEIGAELRYWFKSWNPGTEKMRGFFVGPYGMSSKYDFQYDRDVNYQGEYWSVGLSGGYAMPIGRRKRVNLEFSLAFGYLQTTPRHYQPTDEYDKLIRDKNPIGTMHNLWPTKAKVSLVVPINLTKKEVRYE